MCCLVALASASLHAQPHSFSETGKTAIDNYLSRLIEETYLPGLVAIVTDGDGVIYSGAFGDQDVARGRPMALDTIFRIASMTKPITSVGVMMLVEEGRIDLDDPISRYLPGVVSEEVFETFDHSDNSYTTRPVNGDVTIRHLFTHTSGLGYSNFNDIYYALMGVQSPPASGLDYPLLHDPGAQWTYGASTRVLGMLIERVSGQSLDTYLEDRIFVPLAMSDTGYLVRDGERERVTTVHGKTGQELTERPNAAGPIQANVRGDGGLFSTALDYAKFIRMILNGGELADGSRVLEPTTIELMAQNHIGDLRVELQVAPNEAVARPFPLRTELDTFGLGFQVTSHHDDDSIRSPGSLSWAGVYNTQFWIDPTSGIGAVLLLQYLPFFDDVAIEALAGFEERVYRHLE